MPLCQELGIYIVHDLAYADLVFDGYRAPSMLEVPGAKDIAVEFFTLSKSYNMPGWRVGFMVGNRKLVAALGRIKSYFDYGTFTPIQVASIAALEGPQDCVTEIVDQLQVPPRRPGAWAEQAGLARRTAESHDVRLGANPGAVSRSRLHRVLEEASARREGRGQPRRRLRRARRRPCPFLPDRK